MSALPQLPRSIPDPEHSPTQAKTLTRWAQFVGAVAAGEGIPESKLKYYITNADLEAVTRNDPLEMQKWQDACIAGRKRTRSVIQFQEFFGRLAEGRSMENAQMDVWGTFDPRLIEVIHMDGELHTQYIRAMESRSHAVVGEALALVDDQSRDTLDTLKGPIPNMAAVSRDKLRAETRIRVAGLYNRKDYGDKNQAQVNVQIINHAEVLEAARSRDKLRDKRVTPLQLDAAIDATFSEKTEPALDNWDAQWREEK